MEEKSIFRHHVFGFQRTRFRALGEFRRGGEEHVAGAVQRRLAGILQNADDETDADDLHGDVVVDAEGGAGHRDQEQRAARHA